MKLPLSRKFYLLLVPLLVLVSFVGYVVKIRLNNNSSALVSSLEIAGQANEILANSLIQDDATKAMLIDPNLLAEISEHKIAAYDRNLKLFAILKDKFSEDKPEAVKVIRTILSIDRFRMRPLDTEILELLFEDPAKAQETYFKKYVPLQQQYENGIKDLIAIAQEDAMKEKELLERANRDSFIQIIASLLIGTSIISIGIIFIVRRVSHQLVDNVQELAVDSEKIFTDNHCLDESSEQVLKSSIQHAKLLENLRTCLSEMTEITNEMASKTETCETLSSQGCSDAMNGKQEVGEMATLMEHVQSAMVSIERSNQKMMEVSHAQLMEIEGQIHQVNSESEAIKEIVTQTKILAFNAGVESARVPGEFGRGFLVIADEISKLASVSGMASETITKQLSGAAKKISEVKQSMQVVTNESKDAIVKGRDVTQQTTDKFEQIQADFQAIYNSIQSVSSQMQGILERSHGQKEQIKELSEIAHSLDEAGRSTLEVATKNREICKDLDGLFQSLSSVEKNLANAVMGDEEELAQFHSADHKDRSAA